MEAVKSALGSLPQDSVVLRYLLAAANEITTSDVDLAAVSGAIVLGFNVEPSEAVMAAAKRQGAPPEPQATHCLWEPPLSSALRCYGEFVGACAG